MIFEFQKKNASNAVTQVVFGLGSAAAQTSMPAMSNLTGRYSDKNHSNTSQEKNDNAKASDKMDPDTKKYLRRKGVSLKNLKDKKLKGKLATKEALYKRSARNAAKVEQWLLPSEGGYLEAEGLEKTSNYKQEDIVREVDLLSSRKAFDIKLQEFGPYIVNYTLNGRYMVMAGRKGHLSIIDWKDLRLIKELQVRETVHDVKFLHNELFFATAQKKYTSQLCI